MIQEIFSILAMIIRIYSIIIFVRIIFSWFNVAGNSYGDSQSQVINYLYKITDPYLNWFRRFSFLRISVFDFSAMLGIVFLYFIGNICYEIGTEGQISIIFLVELIIRTVWSFFSSILFILIILLIIRVIFIQLNKYSQLFYTLDGYIEPYVRRFSNNFTKKFTPYKTNLIIVIIAMILIMVAGGFLVNFLSLLI